ncbi:hypothetical protein AGABI2DRAFT_189237 [Agaricus bisporus var. bisporus H97]|uniref:hypothetical protein n=1 Tax=Agaricus bisporus var. bisporus (strain H97 / ATCC MYA-4626 / FGSC 10389) TaxID=936046 RepID=UPI00029F5820|nr:hypothetical protein AGABI2DRAFT_189237 [Agaricus bisporus var. bisporus H97]EKV50906.1 hypothetical protein AGABI2DRAFT_189237 [Agaricus bisporus var. bisporus H97]
MPRENSLSDSEGRSLTPDLEEEQQELEMAYGLVSQPKHPETTLSSAFSQPTAVNPPENGGTTSQASSPTRKPSHAMTRPTVSDLWPRRSARDRFRAAVQKVIAMHRGTTFMSHNRNNERRIGAEPGVDPRRASADLQYGHIRQECTIEITDYSSVRSTIRSLKNDEFIDMMLDDEAGKSPSWRKVRWINIGGVSWDVIKALSLRYDIHPLALEDIFHGNLKSRSKADYYAKHLFLRVLCHQISDHDHEDEKMLFGHPPRSASPEPIDDDRTLKYGSPSPEFKYPKRNRGVSVLPLHKDDVSYGSPNHFRHSHKQSMDERIIHMELDALKRGERVDVDVEPMFIFLFRDGTVISIHPKVNLAFTAPIVFRLRQPDTVLRKSPDPSILVHGLLDLIVDRALQVVDAYHTKICKFERDILIQPKVKTMRHLHIMSGDLILHKRTLEPIKTLLYGLRRYDVDRCAALIDTADPLNANVKVAGYMSHKTKIYLADVFDHMEHILTSLDMFASIAENLIGYSFNSASYDMNVVMRRLTLVTIIGLPLTLLTGYFGMNFDPMWSVNQNSDALFWKIAAPVFVVTVIFALWKDIALLCRFMQKKMFAREAKAMMRSQQKIKYQ